MGRTYCPACGSEEVEMTDAGLTCLNCGYTGHFAEKHSLLEDDDDHEDEEAELLKSVKPKKAESQVKPKSVKKEKTSKPKKVKKANKKSGGKKK